MKHDKTSCSRLMLLISMLSLIFASDVDDVFCMFVQKKKKTTFELKHVFSDVFM